MFEPPTSADLAASDARDAWRKARGLEQRVEVLERELSDLRGVVLGLVAEVTRLKQQADFVQLAKSVLEAVERRQR
jgi:regulator of replication initiation timing